MRDRRRVVARHAADSREPRRRVAGSECREPLNLERVPTSADPRRPACKRSPKECVRSLGIRARLFCERGLI